MHMLYAHNSLEAKADKRQTGVKCRSSKIDPRTGGKLSQGTTLYPRLSPFN